MRCSRCDFENLPGQQRCIKCGSVLTSAGIIDINPPRMAAWKKPMRRLLRSFHLVKGKVVSEKKSKVFDVLDVIISDSVTGYLLSVIPGLAHLIKGRFREIFLYFLLWLACILTGLFFYGSSFGMVCVGLAVGLHTWIALEFGLINELTWFREKIIVGLLTAFFIFLLYAGVFRLASYITGISGGFSSVNVVSYNVQEGDYLLTNRHSSQIERGELVLFSPSIIRIGERYSQEIRTESSMIGQVIGKDGDVVEMLGGAFIVNGQKLDAKKFSVPNWLRNTYFKINLSPSSFFVSSGYNVSAHGLVLTAGDVERLCVIEASGIRGTAFMRWWPMWRRGFLR